MRPSLLSRRRAFSLIELVIVVVILGIIAAIALPRMSKGAAGAADTSLKSSLTVMRKAIDLYQAEHAGAYPKLVDMPAALLQYTDDAGATGAKDSTHVWGPYLRSVPVLPVGADKGLADFVASYAAGHGWDYAETSGAVTANCGPAEKDANGNRYDSY
jgi:prepilin-type N-terminal cleavage/methylation domain-containing protein